MHIGIGTRWFIDVTILLTYDIPFIFYDEIAIDRELQTTTSNSVIEVTNPDVEVTTNDVEIPTLRSDVDKRVSVVRQKLWLRHEAGTTGSASD
jgi:hypothetical protein